MLKAAVPLVLHSDTQPCVDPVQNGRHKFWAQELDSAGTIAKRPILRGTPYAWHKKNIQGHSMALYPWCLKSLLGSTYPKHPKTSSNILKQPASPCFTHLLRLYQGMSLLSSQSWSHPWIHLWTQPQIWP